MAFLAAVTLIPSAALWAEAPLKKVPAALEPLVPARRADLPSQPLRQPDDLKGTATSKPASVNGLDFQTVAQTAWPLPAAGEKTKIKLGLKITNTGAAAQHVNLFDTVKIVLTNTTGNKLTYHWARDATFIPAPILLAAKQSRIVWYDTELEIRPEGNHLVGSDGAGGQWWYIGVQAGQYSVAFTMHSREREYLETVIARHLAGKPDAAPFWQGEATTSPVTIDVTTAR